MKLSELKKRVVDELNSRNLADPRIRINALNKICLYLAQTEYIKEGLIDFPEDKNELKKVYQNIKGKALNGAESSVINEMYNQIIKINFFAHLVLKKLVEFFNIVFYSFNTKSITVKIFFNKEFLVRSDFYLSKPTTNKIY